MGNSKTPQTFNNAGMAYAAFNLRDPYYREMARLVMTELKQAGIAKNLDVNSVVDLGAGIGISTMELRAGFANIFAVEPESSMHYLLQLNFMGSPVDVFCGKAENLSEIIPNGHQIDAVVACQMFHLLRDNLSQCLEQIGHVLSRVRDGLLCFDLGPSNYFFTSHEFSDHRSRHAPKPNQIMTELSHPLYRAAHDKVLDLVKERYPEFDRDNLWPPVAKSYTQQELDDVLGNHGFVLERKTELMVPIVGSRIPEFIRNGWAVFFRWPPLDKLSMDEKLELMKPALEYIHRSSDLKSMFSVPAYHPTAIFTYRYQK